MIHMKIKNDRGLFPLQAPPRGKIEKTEFMIFCKNDEIKIERTNIVVTV